MAVTLKQIAEELGVSQPLVTYALNGRPGVSDAMRQKIQETAARMGYDKSANHEAQMLIARRYGRRVQSGMIALVYPLMDDFPCVPGMPFYRSLLEGIEIEAGHRELDLLITPTRRERIPRIIRERRIDGIIYVTDILELHPEFQDIGIPAISLCTWNPTTHNIVPSNEEGIYRATAYLLKLGHRRIAFSGSNGSFQGKERYKGYRRALAEHDVAYDPKLVVQPVMNFCREIDGWTSMEALLKRNTKDSTGKPDFTAIVCHNDSIAMGVARCAQEAGLKVPEALSIVGFDDISLQYNFLPSITSIAYSRQDIGRAGVDWLCREIDIFTKSPDQAGYRPSYGLDNFPITLSVRDSTHAVAGKLRPNKAYG